MKVFFNTTLFGTKAQDDRRPTYLEVIIKRTDVLALKVSSTHGEADRRQWAI